MPHANPSLCTSLIIITIRVFLAMIRSIWLSSCQEVDNVKKILMQKKSDRKSSSDLWKENFSPNSLLPFSLSGPIRFFSIYCDISRRRGKEKWVFTFSFSMVTILNVYLMVLKHKILGNLLKQALK